MKRLRDLVNKDIKAIAIRHNSRYVISGLQLAAINELIHDMKQGTRTYHGNPANSADFINSITINQKIGESESTLEEDVNDLKNLFASWIGRTK